MIGVGSNGTSIPMQVVDLDCCGAVKSTGKGREGGPNGRGLGPCEGRREYVSVCLVSPTKVD